MLFMSLLAFAVLLDNPNPPIGRQEPLRPPFEFHAQPPLNAWHQIQPALDRGSGRIVDSPTFELDRRAMLQLLDHSPFDPADNFRIFREDYDHALRVDARQLDQRALSQQSTAAQREAKMQLKEYELYLNDTSDPYSAVAAQAEADRIALERAKSVRDSQLKDAGNDSTKVRAINETYARERSRILGFESVPATKPSK